MKPESKCINFEETYVNYFARMKRFAKEYVIHEEDAENIVHDVFLEVWEKRERLNLQTNLIAYLFTAIKNRCIDSLRKRILEEEIASTLREEYYLTLQINLDSLNLFNHESLHQEKIEKMVTNAINQLPEKCRTIFVMNKIEGRKQKDIAEELNISINTVEKQMSIAYKKLKEELRDYLPLLFFVIDTFL